jgi:hypothetical protein
VTAPFDDDAATIIGITTAAIAAGTHTVRMVAACDPRGPNQQVVTPSARVGVVLLGPDARSIPDIPPRPGRASTL